MVLSKVEIASIGASLVLMTMLALWSIDMSVSAMLSGGGKLINGFYSVEPVQLYHIGLYLIIMACFINFLIILHVLYPEKQPVKKDEKTNHGILERIRKRIRYLTKKS